MKKMRLKALTTFKLIKIYKIHSRAKPLYKYTNYTIFNLSNFYFYGLIDFILKRIFQ